MVFPQRSSLVSWPDYIIMPIEDSTYERASWGNSPDDSHFVTELWPCPSPCRDNRRKTSCREGGVIIWSINKWITRELLNPLLFLRKGESSYHFLSHFMDTSDLVQRRGETIFFSYNCWDFLVSGLIKILF